MVHWEPREFDNMAVWSVVSLSAILVAWAGKLVVPHLLHPRLDQQNIILRRHIALDVALSYETYPAKHYCTISLSTKPCKTPGIDPTYQVLKQNWTDWTEMENHIDKKLVLSKYEVYNAQIEETTYRGLHRRTLSRKTNFPEHFDCFIIGKYKKK